MHRLRNPLPRVASISLFTLGAASTVTTLGACGDDETTNTDELFDTLREVCDSYESCDPDWFDSEYGSVDGCFEYFTQGFSTEQMDDLSQECIDGANRFWNCMLDAYEGCTFDSEIYAQCDAIGDAVIEECGLDYDY